MNTTASKPGPKPKLDYRAIDEDGLFVPATSKRRIFNIGQAAYRWAKNNGTRFSCIQQEDKAGKVVGVLISLIPWVWVCKHHGQGDKPVCGECVREDGKMAGGELG